MKTSSVAAETIDSRRASGVPGALTTLFERVSLRTRTIAFFVLCALIIVATRWGYAFATPPHTPIYANFDIGFQYLYADYFRDHGTFPSAPADISQGALDGYFWWWWNNDYYSNYMGLAAAMIGAFMWLGVPYIPAYAIVTWLADIGIAVLAYRLVSVAGGRRAGGVAALLVAVHPLFVWGMYQSHVQISVGMALFLGVIACWRWWSDDSKWPAVVVGAVLALAASHAHAFFLSMLLGTFLPAVVLHTLLFQRNRRAIFQQAAFAAAVTLALFANTRFWLHLDAYSEVTKWMIGRGDAWGQLPSPLFLLGFSPKVDSWRFGPAWFVVAAFVAVLVFASVQSFRARDTDARGRSLAVVFSLIFAIDVVFMIGAHRIQYDYWILRHAQFHSIAAILPVSIGLGWLMRSPRIAWRGSAWALAGALAGLCFSVSFDQMFVGRSHGPAFARFVADEHRPKLPYQVVLYPGGTALTPFTCAVTETPTYDLHPGSIPPLLDHLSRYYGWKPGDEINVLWYSAVSRITREEMHFTEVLGEWSTPDESVVLGKARLDFNGQPQPLATPTDGWALTDRINFDDSTSEGVHQYRVNAPVFKGTALFFRESDATVHVKTGRATRSFEEFRMKVAPGSDHALVKAFNTVSTGQIARVIIDGGAPLTWDVGSGTERYAESTLSIPAQLIGNKQEIGLRIEYVAGSIDINSFGYWMYAKPTAGIAYPLLTETVGYQLADRLDVGDAADEAAHHYAVTEPTFAGYQVFTLSDKRASYQETGRATKAKEAFRLRATPGKDHLLVKVYDNYSRDQKVRVVVDGELVGTWELPTRDERYGEASFVIPASFVHGDSIDVEVQFVSASFDQNSFVYWLYARPSSAATEQPTAQNGPRESRALQSLRPQSAPF
ncbi:MAG TPA: hypothetical protein VMG12_00455 [Polyangiaceae bacterium]|nr:hypothetical protein [Polyangiaceae bacterium]